MNIRIIIAIILLFTLSTITLDPKIVLSKFKINKINVENNFLLKEVEIKNLLIDIYSQNLLLLKNKEIENALMQDSLIGSFKIKKKYPDTLNIKIFEKKPVVILQTKKNKFYLTEKNELIKFKMYQEFKDLPYVLGNRKEFGTFYVNLKKINFPLNSIKKYTLYELNRWDLETVDGKIIKLPPKNYTKYLKNYLDMKKKNSFQKYKIFDFRINDQLILK
tara:strand:+ start:2361 stop:3017 length:657 start_codon:yes stop_codon:yes gene_type:complete